MRRRYTTLVVGELYWISCESDVCPKDKDMYAGKPGMYMGKHARGSAEFFMDGVVKCFGTSFNFSVIKSED